MSLLKDGRLFVIEYKGGDRVSNADSKEKCLIGELCTKKSGGKGIYLMAQKTDEQGRACASSFSTLSTKLADAL